MAFNVSADELQAFHSMDRDLYTRLVIDLSRESKQVRKVMAFWLWLEESGYISISQEIQSRALSDHVVNAVVDEGLAILSLLQSENLSEDAQFPITFEILQHHVTVGCLHESRRMVLDGVAKKVTELCPTTFGVEEGQNTVSTLRNAAGSVDPFVNQNRPIAEHRMVSYQQQPRPRLIMPNFPFLLHGVLPASHRPPPVYFRGMIRPAPLGIGPNVYVPTMVHPNAPMLLQQNVPMPVRQLGRSPQFEAGGSSNNEARMDPLPRALRTSGVNPRVDELVESNEPIRSRALFMTFSKGYVVSHEELADYLSRTYGDVVEKIEMQEVVPGVQALYARVVLRTAGNVDDVLDGKERVKFDINGKHVYARKFVFK